MTSPATTYTALARRYRPQNFAEVIGQEHVATALRNALRKDRVAHAYLFTGARGVGKTSTARIFAKALNCPNVTDGVPCGVCDICTAIAVGQDVDVQEIDAASNRGIDDVRQLRANVNLRPMRSRHKVYIIDEAHQLSRDAWNALLKTLEEPPPNVKFFFCTTEPNKLPDTILSRCQRFDFASVGQTDIVGRLQQIAAAEGYTVDSAALDLVARRAAGSMRDSQSLFDQLLAFGSDTIDVADVHRLFGTADDDRLIALGAAIASRQPAGVLTQLSDAIDGGVQLGELFDQLIAYHRDLMVLAAGADTLPLLSVAEDRRAVLAGQATQTGLQTLLAAMQILSEARQRLNRSGFLRPVAELALMRVSLLSDLDQLSDLIAAVRGAGKGAIPPRRTPPLAAPNSSPAQKKSNDSSSEVVNNTPELPIRRDLQPGQEAAIRAQLLMGMPPVLSTHVSAAESFAIIGPNALEILFPRQYRASCLYCEGPGRSVLEDRLAEMVGQPARVTCRLQEGKSPIPKPDSTPQATNTPVTRGKTANWQRVEADEVPDEFVKRAIQLFEPNDIRRRTVGEKSDDQST